MKYETKINIRLRTMMFLQYLLLAVWWVPLAAYLANMDITELEKTLILSSMAIGSMASPVLGALADRYFAAQKVLSVSNFITAFLLIVSSFLTSPTWLFVLILLTMLCYMPTWSLTSSIAMRHTSAEEFPRMRMYGSLGWVASGLFSLVAVHLFRVELFDGSNLPMICGGVTAFLAGLQNLTLPNTPANRTTDKVSIKSLLGFDAFTLLKDRNFLVFMLVSFLAIIPFALYFTFGSEFLQTQQFRYITVTMNWGQVAEMLFLFLATSIIRKIGVKHAMLWGLLALVLRYAAFYAGVDFGWPSLFIVAILVHGLIFGLFFVGGQVYTDNQAPQHLKAQAQGLLSFIVWGVGLLIGNFVCGSLLDFYTVSENGVMVCDWGTVFLITMVISVAVTLLFLFCFKSDKKS